MKQRLLYILQYYLFFVSIFLLQKVAFIGIHHTSEMGLLDGLSIIKNGLPMDLTTAGYIVLLPFILIWLALGVKGKWIDIFFRYYTGIIIALLAIITISDIILFDFWKSHIDNTAIFYLKSPTEAVASVSFWVISATFLAIVAVSSALIFSSKKVLFTKSISTIPTKKPALQSVAFTLLLIILFITIRGGIGVATMNVGRVYFSGNMFYNQAAINPVFNLLYSLSHQDKEAVEYNFMTDTEASSTFAQLLPDSTDTEYPKLLNSERPNVILLVLESFSAKVIGSLGGEPNVTPRINKLCNEGILFTNFQANSFRTDRGLVSLLSGTPSLPTTPLLKYPTKLNRLPSISGSLKAKGYDLSMLYGGDLNFANMRQYFVCAGFENITNDVDFPVKDRLSKWGVHDHVTFNHLYQSIAQQKKAPFMKMFLTLSSHEPFDVPYKRFSNKYLNSIAYTDSCIGDFIDKLKKLPSWKNTIVIMLADHSTLYPESMTNENPERYHIPMLWVGGAIKQPAKIDTLAAQSDLAATLLGQLNIPSKEFKFSRNLMLKSTPKVAFFSYINGFGFMSKQDTFVYDCGAKQELYKKGVHAEINAIQGKAYLETLLKDFNQR